MTKGIRISQAGIPLNRAADYQKTMDERWPVLEHLFMGVVSIENATTNDPGVLKNAGDTIADIPVFQHNLGYLPAFRVKQISYSGPDTFNSPIADMMYADEKTIYLRVYKSAGVVSMSAKFFLAVIDRDCTQTFQSPIDIVTANQSSQPSAYGLKILNSPGDMNEKNKSKFTFNTNAKSMLVQQTGIISVANNVVTADHRLGYPPTYYMAKRFTADGAADPIKGRTVMRPIDRVLGLARSNSITLTVRGAQAVLVGDYMFIVLKDPVDTAR